MFEKQEADVEFDSGTFVAMVEKMMLKTRTKAMNITVTVSDDPAGASEEVKKYL